MLILSSSPRLFGSIAYDSTGSGNFIGGNGHAIGLVAERVVGQRVLQLGDRAEIAGLDFRHVGLRLALQQHAGGRAAPARPCVLLWTVESDFSDPDTTRNIVIRPANGSAMVFHTNADAGAFSSAARGDVAAVLVDALERPVGRRRQSRRRSRRAAAGRRC